MPWTVDDVDEHKKGLSESQKKKWVKIANATLKETGDEGEAIATANKEAGRTYDGLQGVNGWPDPMAWHPGMMETRLAAINPKTYSKENRSVDAVLSRGSPVERFYGTESLRIHKDAIVLDRMKQGGIPLLDSHRQDSITSALGTIRKAWIEGKALMGTLTFNQTEAGERAEGMVSRKEIGAVSAGYNVKEWEIRNSDGDVIDPEVQRIRWDEKLSFEATRWEVLEASLVAVPADASAVIRMVDTAFMTTSIFDTRRRGDVKAIRARALALQRMITRTAHR